MNVEVVDVIVCYHVVVKETKEDRFVIFDCTVSETAGL